MIVFKKSSELLSVHCGNRTISAAVTRTAAAYPAPPGGCSLEGCCGGKRRISPALLRGLAVCSPCTPHPANPPRPGPRLGFFSAAPPGLEQLLSAGPTPHSPAPSHPSIPDPPARPGWPAGTAPAIRLPRGPHHNDHTPLRPTHPTLSPLPHARAVGLKDPPKLNARE